MDERLIERAARDRADEDGRAAVASHDVRHRRAGGRLRDRAQRRRAGARRARCARESAAPVFILGAGSNILVGDARHPRRRHRQPGEGDARRAAAHRRGQPGRRCQIVGERARRRIVVWAESGVVVRGAGAADWRARATRASSGRRHPGHARRRRRLQRRRLRRLPGGRAARGDGARTAANATRTLTARRAEARRTAPARSCAASCGDCVVLSVELALSTAATRRR